MNYRNDRYGNNLSLLGYGCMRFSSKNGKIDLEKAEQEIMAAFRAGVNYYDTAYIATKLPHYLIKNRESMEKYFAEQLKLLRTDHVDYYLIRALLPRITVSNQMGRWRHFGNTLCVRDCGKIPRRLPTVWSAASASSIVPSTLRYEKN